MISDTFNGPTVRARPVVGSLPWCAKRVAVLKRRARTTTSAREPSLASVSVSFLSSSTLLVRMLHLDIERLPNLVRQIFHPDSSSTNMHGDAQVLHLPGFNLRC